MKCLCRLTHMGRALARQGLQEATVNDQLGYTNIVRQPPMDSLLRWAGGDWIKQNGFVGVLGLIAME